MTFKSRIDNYYIIFIIILLVFYNSIPLYSILTKTHDSSDYFQFIPFFAFSILTIIGSKQTNYKVKNGILIVKGLFVNETIPIHRIHSITAKKKLIPNLKLSTAQSGLLLKYQTHYSIFITPKQQEKFIQELLEVNENILINSKDFIGTQQKNINPSL